MARILLIENDSGFAADLARVLTSAGYETQVVGEGKEGLATASAWRPHGIVLCVELPDVSGYLVCQRLKKDEALRGVPLVLTSADATEKSFADHQKLKVHADEYLLKPYVPDALLEILARRVGVPEGAPNDEEELVRLGDALDGNEGGLPALDLETFGGGSRGLGSRGGDAPATAGRDEDDLFLDGLTGLGDVGPGSATAAHDDGEDEAPSPSGLELDLDSSLADRPVRADDLDAAADSLPDDSRDPSLAAPAGLGGDDDAPRGALSDDEKTDSQALPPQPGGPRVRPASADLLRAAGIKLLDDEEPPARPPAAPVPARPPSPAPGSTRAMPALQISRPGGSRLEPADQAAPTPPPITPGGHQAERLERELAEVRGTLSDTRSEILSRESEIRQLKEKLGAVTRRAGQAEADVRAARTEAGEASELRARLEAAERRAEDAAGARAGAEKRAAEAERRTAEATSRAEADLEKNLEALRAELTSARAEAEALRGQLEAVRAEGGGDRTSAALERRIAELEMANARNEERVLKAYQKIRGDEKVRDKVRKALSIASQLMDEGMAPDPSAEKDRRAAGPAPREPAT